MSDTALVVHTVAGLFRDTHERARQALDGLDVDALDWVPAPDANSIAVLTTHLLGSERETLATVLGTPVERNRGAEFRARADPVALRRLLNDADARLDDLEAAAPTLDLSLERTRGSDPTPRRLAEMLISNYAHAREHVGHIELTAQLWRQRDGG